MGCQFCEAVQKSGCGKCESRPATCKSHLVTSVRKTLDWGGSEVIEIPRQDRRPFRVRNTCDSWTRCCADNSEPGAMNRLTHHSA